MPFSPGELHSSSVKWIFTPLEHPGSTREQGFQPALRVDELICMQIVEVGSAVGTIRGSRDSGDRRYITTFKPSAESHQLLSTAVTVNSFNVPPTGLCYVGVGGDCMRCDCNKPLKCYKGTCR
ncbi:unnamed protein product [Strongylus vulgaris]|uniref:Uncharacterized protein n=1 Tax=Strongylus vulgaris TaxID=40348 RepID=A0A3P7J9E5_STRVU|nr:unnamed protein product [Strongylus vulgaris]